jgi:hypothetical protein
MHEALTLSDQELKVALLAMADLKRAILKSDFEASVSANGNENSPVTQGFYNGFNAPEFKEVREREAELVVKWLRDPATRLEDIAPKLPISEGQEAMVKFITKTMATNAALADFNENQKKQYINRAVKFQKECIPLFRDLDQRGTKKQVLDGLDTIIEISRDMNIPIESLAVFSDVDDELIRRLFKTREAFEAGCLSTLENIYGENGVMKKFMQSTLDFMMDSMLILNSPFVSDEELEEIKLAAPKPSEDSIDEDLMRSKETARNYFLDCANRIFGN